MSSELCYALRGAFGAKLVKNLENPEVVFEHPLTSPNEIRVMKFSNDGQHYAFCDSTKTRLIDVDTGKVLIEHDLPKPTAITFSPKDNVFCTWEPYVVYGLRRDKNGEIRTPNPNLHFFSLKEMKHLVTMTAKKKEEIPQWTTDEKYMVRLAGSELFVMDGVNIEEKQFKTVIQDVSTIEVSPNCNEYSFAAFIPVAKSGTPAKVEVRKIASGLPIITSQTLMNCDKINMMWNSRGSHLLVLSTQEVDTSGQSYYGRSFLNVISSNGDKIRVDFDKNGPIHDLKWIPGSSSFAVCYGFMPAKVSVYNFNGNKTWDLGEGPRNEIHFNPQGSIMITCGFGSLAAGKIQIWDVEKEKEINAIEVPNTTHLGFSADGQYFYTAIEAPRMRVDNSYRMWHFSGRQIYEFIPEKYELWEIQFRKLPPNKVPAKITIPDLTKEEKLKTGVSVKLKDGKQVTAGAIKKAGAYVPPNKRKEGSNEGALKPVGSTNTVKTEEDKKIKKLKSDLQAIKKMKKKQEEGGTLEKNQLDKIARECELQKELAELLATSG